MTAKKKRFVCACRSRYLLVLLFFTVRRVRTVFVFAFVRRDAGKELLLTGTCYGSVFIVRLR